MMAKCKEIRKHRMSTVIAAMVFAVVLVVAFSKDSFAAIYTDSAVLSGAPVTVSLNVGNISATADTSCSASSASCTVVTHFTFYYTDSNNVAHKTTTTSSNLGGGYAVATAGSFGDDVRGVSGTSNHMVQYNGQQWTRSLP